MERTDRLKTFFRSLATSDLQCRIINGEDRINADESLRDEMTRRIALEAEGISVIEAVLEERYRENNHLPEYSPGIRG